MSSNRKLTVPEKHQLNIARQTLRMNDAMANVMGGMTKEEARRVIKELTGRDPYTAEDYHRDKRARDAS